MTYQRLCDTCAKVPCPACGGVLAETDKVFPYSLFRAIEDADADEVVRLLRRSIDLNNLNVNGDTPLSLAARLKDKKVAIRICEILIDHGADPRARASDAGGTALIMMSWYRMFNRDIADLLRSSINDQDNEKRTALMFAAAGQGMFGLRRGNLTIAKELLALGADLSIRGQLGMTALGYAIRSNDTNNNNDMVDFIKDEMIKEAALREFRQRHSYKFDERGCLNID